MLLVKNLWETAGLGVLGHQGIGSTEKGQCIARFMFNGLPCCTVSGARVRTAPLIWCPQP